MRERLHGFVLILAAGAAILGLHALGGLLLTPFFGATPLFWSTAVVSAPLALGLGFLAGQPAARAATRRLWLPSLLGALAGLLVIGVPAVLAPFARAILDRDPDSPLAAPAAVLALITLPSAIAAAAIPGLVERARGRTAGAAGGTDGAARGRVSGRASARSSGRRAAAGGGLGAPGVPLLLLSLGGIAGIAACAPTLLEPGRGRSWAPLWAFGWALLGAGVLGLRPLAGAAVVAAGAALVPAFLLRPNELREFEFEKALRQAWSLRVGKYYLDTAGRPVLDRSEVARRYAALREQIAYAPDKSVAAVLVVETLRNLGPATITGEGLREIIDLYLSDRLRPRLRRLLDKIAAVRSDGKGEISVALRRLEEDEAVEVTIDNERGETTTLAFEADFTLSIRVETDPAAGETRTTVDIGPLEVEKAGFFGSNDTYRTPVLIRDAALFFDAHLLGFSIVSRKEEVVILVRAQGAVGAVKTQVLQVVDLARPASGGRTGTGGERP